MFLIDKIPKKIINKSNIVNQSFEKLSVKNNAEKDKYFYYVKKLSLCIAIVIITLLIGWGISIKDNRLEKSINTIKRDNIYEKDYEVVIKNEKGEEETMVLNIKPKELTVDETYKLFDKIKRPLIKKILGENKSLDKINKPLNFVSEYGNRNIKITWNISDDKILNYDGTIGENVSKKGTIIKLTATMTFDKVTVDYSFNANIFPGIKSHSTQGNVQKYINENDIYSTSINLPQNINGKNIKFYWIDSKSEKYITIIGISIAVILFFLKDRDLKKDVANRNAQMLKDYPEIVSKILLYYEAGLSIRGSLEKIIIEYKREKNKSKKIFKYAYEELEMATIKIKSGISEVKAINEFGNRCKLHNYMKLSNIIEQNIKRGTRQMSVALKSEVDIALVERKNNALKEGNEISTKLLGPMILMLGVSIGLIIIPAFMSMNI